MLEFYARSITFLVFWPVIRRWRVMKQRGLELAARGPLTPPDDDGTHPPPPNPVMPPPGPPVHDNRYSVKLDGE